jgi:hypothetical protein
MLLPSMNLVRELINGGFQIIDVENILSAHFVFELGDKLEGAIIPAQYLLKALKYRLELQYFVHRTKAPDYSVNYLIKHSFAMDASREMTALKGTSRVSLLLF